MSTLRPVWFLDVDGVVNSIGEPKAKFGPTTVVDVTADNGETYPIRFFPAVVDRINALHRTGLADVVWLTTWNHSAASALAPAIGLDDFAVLADPGSDTHARHPYDRDRPWWKYALVLEHLGPTPGRPVVWTDDDLDRRTKDRLRAVHDGPAKLITPMPVPGLRAEHLDSIEAFCLTHAPRTEHLMAHRKEIAKITETFLGANGDTRGILTATLTVDLGGGVHRRVGGYALGSKDTAFGMQFVAALMRAAGAESWESMVGRTVFVLTDERDQVVGIENLPTEPGERFVFDELAAQYTQKERP